MKVCVEKIITQISNIQMKICAEVLRQLLNREPIDEDFKDLTIYVSDNYSNISFLAYKGLKLGKIEIDLFSQKVEFTPLNHRFLNEAVVNNKITF